MNRIADARYATNARLEVIADTSYLRNIDSIRCVTAKPPNMLIVASAMPPTDSQRIHSLGRDRSAEILERSGAICTSAPIAMMLDTAFVTLINGVCRDG